MRFRYKNFNDLNQYYIQYHNADNMGNFPDTESTDIDSITLDTVIRDDFGIFTKKQLVEKAIGDFCFLIVGTGKPIKKYYLWSFFLIEEVQRDREYFDAFGTGFNFERPIFLNDLPGFVDFKSYCGNFGIGFQNITKHEFCKTLVAFTHGVHPSIDTSQQANTQQMLLTALDNLNERMQQVAPEKRSTKIEVTLRKDRKIVALLKKAANYKCQFPGCTSEIKTKAGFNYVEVAHVMPVNKGGQSILGNLVVLCPNHHKEFDYGDLQIVEQTLNSLSGSLNGRNFRIELIKPS